jgi:hypothetical protein
MVGFVQGLTASTSAYARQALGLMKTRRSVCHVAEARLIQVRVHNYVCMHLAASWHSLLPPRCIICMCPLIDVSSMNYLAFEQDLRSSASALAMRITTETKDPPHAAHAPIYPPQIKVWNIQTSQMCVVIYTYVCTGRLKVICACLHQRPCA